MSYQDQDEIRRLFEEVYPSNVRNRDVQGYADMYTEDAVWIPPGDTTRCSPNNIVEGFALQIAKSDIDPIFIAEEIEVMGDFGYVIGTSQAKIQFRENDELKHAIYRALWLVRKEQGTWKIARQIWNS